MRVAHVSCVAPPEIGGIGRVAAQEVTLLQSLGVDAYQVSLTTHAGFRYGNMGSISALDLLVREADIVHLHYPFYGTAGTVVRLRRKNVIQKLVLTLHMDATARGIRGLAFNLHRRLFQDRILEAADVLIVSSEDYAEYSSYQKWAPKCIKIPFGVDEGFFTPAGTKPTYFNLNDQATVGFVGGMDEAHAFKGIDVLLHAVAGFEGIQLLMVGDGPLRKRYEALAAQLGLASRCTFVGKLNEPDLVMAYQSMDVLAVPSISAAEAFSLVALEAQACGVPVIASNLPGVRTVIADHETGLLVQPNDVRALRSAIETMIDDVPVRLRYARAARQRVLEKFTWTKHAEALMRVYTQIA